MSGPIITLNISLILLSILKNVECAMFFVHSLKIEVLLWLKNKVFIYG